LSLYRASLSLGLVERYALLPNRPYGGTTGLCRNIAGPTIANERLKRSRAGQVVLQLKISQKDGTTHIPMSPLEQYQEIGLAAFHRDIVGFEERLQAFCLYQSTVRLSPSAKETDGRHFMSS
jgi:hypothetical protein